MCLLNGIKISDVLLYRLFNKKTEERNIKYGRYVTFVRPLTLQTRLLISPNLKQQPTKQTRHTRTRARARTQTKEKTPRKRENSMCSERSTL